MIKLDDLVETMIEMKADRLKELIYDGLSADKRDEFMADDMLWIINVTHYEKLNPYAYLNLYIQRLGYHKYIQYPDK